MTSVKDFRITREPGEQRLGEGLFWFSDRYSVFDWGEMPDKIKGKGSSLCTMGAFNFELLSQEGIPNHFRGVQVNGKIKELGEAIEPPNLMGIELTRVPDLPVEDATYQYDSYFSKAGDNYLIPLEIVFRNTVPPGSSLRQRKNPEDFGLDRNAWPEDSFELPEPVVEFSTKYEKQDRYLNEYEANRLAGEADLAELKSIALRVNSVLNERACEVGLEHNDGKIECLFFNGTVKVADVVGTFDENRFTRSGVSLSKEFLREFYRQNDPGWYDALKEAKKEAKNSDTMDWKSLCGKEPQSLPGELKNLASNLYRSGTNVYTGKEWYDVPDLKNVVKELKRLT